MRFEALTSVPMKISSGRQRLVDKDHPEYAGKKLLETLVRIYQAKRRHIPKYWGLQVLDISRKPMKFHFILTVRVRLL
jgi:hypothetical protein